MNETRRLHPTEPLDASFATNLHKDTNSLSPKFQKTPANSSIQKRDCRGGEPFATSPIQMDFDAPEPADDRRDAEEASTDDGRRDELDAPFPRSSSISIDPPEETDERRRRREIEESEALARRLVAEEALASYNAHSAFLRDNAHRFSPEDLAALQSALAEEDPEYEEGDEGGSGGMSYDALLRLGERIGDVKEERWALVAREKIRSIPLLVWDASAAEGKDREHTEVKCQICQFAYEEGEELRRLGCGHCFHRGCIDEWLGKKDTCAFCRKSIVDIE